MHLIKTSGVEVNPPTPLKKKKAGLLRLFGNDGKICTHGSVACFERTRPKHVAAFVLCSCAPIMIIHT